MWKIVGRKVVTIVKLFKCQKIGPRLFMAVLLSLCFHPATHMDVLHIQGVDIKLKRSKGKLSASYLDVRRTELSTSNRTSTHTHVHNHNELPHQLFSTSQFIVCNLPFLLPAAAAGLLSTSKQELCCLPFPPHLNVINKEWCCLLAFCLGINKGQKD